MTRRGRNENKAPAQPDQAYVTALLDAISNGDAGLERLATLLQDKPLDARTVLQLAEQLQALGGVQRQQHAANQKHATNKKAKAYAIEQFRAVGGRFPSKIEFARWLLGKVRAKYRLKVKAETIARDWLPMAGEVEALPPSSIAYAAGRYVVPKIKS